MKIPGVRRVDGYSVEVDAKDYEEAQSWAVVFAERRKPGMASHD